jgi:hypothetical protein
MNSITFLTWNWTFLCVGDGAEEDDEVCINDEDDVICADRPDFSGGLMTRMDRSHLIVWQVVSD